MKTKNKNKNKTYPSEEIGTAVLKGPAVAYRSSVSSLGSFVVMDDYSLIKKARKGVKTEVFYSLADAISMPEKTLASIINLSPRTISNYRDQEKHLDANYSEHLLKLVSLYQFGREVFGNLEDFDLWLNRPFWGSDDRPMDFISTPGGVDLVREEIEKLALGYPL